MGGRESDLVLLDENGIRCDGRKINETRKVTIKAGVLKMQMVLHILNLVETKFLLAFLVQEMFILNIYQIQILEFYV